MLDEMAMTIFRSINKLNSIYWFMSIRKPFKITSPKKELSPETRCVTIGLVLPVGFKCDTAACY